MKMKKLFLTIVVALVVLAAATTNVNAATVSSVKEEVGKAVAVTVDFGSAESADGTVTYDPEVLTFVSGPEVTFEPTPGTINFSMSKIGGLKTLTFNFTAKAEGTSAVAVNVTSSVDATAVGTFNGSVEVTKKAEEVKPPVDPTPVDPTPVDPTPVTPEDGNGSSSNGNGATTPDNGNGTTTPSAPAANPAPVATANPAPVAANGMPTRLPQTGVNYAIVAVIALAIVAAAIGTIKLNNK